MGDSPLRGHHAVVRRIEALAQDICLVEVESASKSQLPGFSAGAHVDVLLPDGMSRSYSLISEPTNTNSYEFAVARDPQGRGASLYIHDRLRKGDALQLTGPRNAFPLVEQAPAHVFIAGGIGITPIWAMIQALERRHSSSWKLVYAARSPERMAFRTAFEELGRRSPGAVKFHFDSDVGKPLDVAAVVSAASPEAHLYCCGPAPMLDAFEAATATYAPDRVHVERFAPAVPVGGETFTVRLARSGREFRIPPSSTILDELLDGGIHLEFSCMSGMCGSCRVGVLDGKPDHRDQILTDAERAAGNCMMVCCSRAQTQTLVLDL